MFGPKVEYQFQYLQGVDTDIFNKRHGGPYDRGAADAWYGRGPNPHYFVKDTYFSREISGAELTEEDIVAYYAGYLNEPFNQKCYGE